MKTSIKNQTGKILPKMKIRKPTINVKREACKSRDMKIEGVPGSEFREIIKPTRSYTKSNRKFHVLGKAIAQILILTKEILKALPISYTQFHMCAR